MYNVAMKSKLTIAVIVISVLSIIIFKYIYKIEYLQSYQNITLEKINQCNNKQLKVSTPYWVSITSEDYINNIEKSYGVDLSAIDLKKNMLIISYGAELNSIDYNLKESMYKTRKTYIGFPTFGSSNVNMIFFYKSTKIPLIDTDVAGFPPDYRGKYR